jgi:hypothetical protein
MRLLSAGAGAVLVAIAIALRSTFSNSEKEVQIAVWTMVVLTMVILVNHEHFRKQWFWQGLLLGLLLHVVVIWGSGDKLPFSSLGVVILVSVPEALVWQVIFRMVSRN